MTTLFLSDIFEKRLFAGLEIVYKPNIVEFADTVIGYGIIYLQNLDK